MKRLAISALALAATLHGASASVAPDPSDSTVLVADVAEGVTETYADKIATSYAKFVKTGKGTLILTAASSQTSSTDFMGSVEVREGVLQLDEYYALKSCSYNSDATKYNISVSSNAQIRVTFNSKGQNDAALYNVAIEGDGPDGRGAFVFDGGGTGDSLIRYLHLTGDASIGGTGRFGVGYWGHLYLNGHTLTGTNSKYMFRSVRVIDGKEGHFVKRGGEVTMQNGDTEAQLRGSAANTFTISNATLVCHNTPTLDSLWTLRSIDSSSFAVNVAGQWCGPIIGDGTKFTVIGSSLGSVCNLYGTISNFTTFATSKDNENFTLNLINANHYFDLLYHYHGDMVVTGGQHHVFGNITVNHADTTKAASLTFKDAGEVVITNGATMNRVYSGNSSVAPARMEISGKTNFRGESGTTFMVGDDSTASWADQYPNYRGSLAVTDGATMTNDTLQVGYRGAGALYQRDSDVYVGRKLYLGYGSGNKNGARAYGYWGATNSQLTLAGGLEMAYATNSAAFFVQRGGRTDITDSNITHISQQGHAGVYVGNGGVLNKLSGNLYFGRDGSGFGDGGSASLTVDGEGSLIDLTGRVISWMRNKNFKTFVNLNNGGTLRTYRIQYESHRSNLAASRSYLSFDGGVLDIAPTSENADYKVFMEWSSGAGQVYSEADVCTVFGGGAVLGVTRADAIVHWTSPLLKPSGKSVTAIALPTDADFGTTTHLGALRVVIEGEGEGEGASAFVDFDDATGAPSKIIVTSPGINYVEGTTTAKVIEMRANKEWSCAVTLGEIKGGGLTKIGPGMLILKGEATYEGATTVRAGTLLLGTLPFPQGQPMVLAGGQFNAAARDITVSDLSGYGTYSSVNGQRVTITNKLSFAAADVVAGRQMTFVSAEPVFGAGATIEVDTTGLADNQEPHRFVLATSEKAFVGTPVLANASLKWGIRFSADRKSILFRRVRGQAISFR
jgi:autotransporter-associated beta strand protein